MPLLSYLWPNGRQHSPTPPFQHQESKILAGILAEIGLIKTLIAPLDDDDAQQVVSKCGEYLRYTLEEELGYERMDHLFQAAGLGPASHLAPKWSEARIMGTDNLDYERPLTPRERLTDRAQRLDSIAKLIVEFGFNGIRSYQKKACAYLFELRPNTKRNQASIDE